MKRLSLVCSVVFTSLIIMGSAKAQYVEDFNRRLETIYDQANKNTLTQQVIYGSIEAVAVYKLEGLIHKPDRKAIASAAAQIEALKKSEGQEYFPKVSEEQRRAQLAAAKRKLLSVQGTIFQRMARGTVKLLTRGAQVFLILDIGTRIYILTNLTEKDPGFVPSYNLLCTEVDCQYAIDRVIEVSNDAYNEARGNTDKQQNQP